LANVRPSAANREDFLYSPWVIGRDDRIYKWSGSLSGLPGTDRGGLLYYVWNWDLNLIGTFNQGGLSDDRFLQGLAARGRLYSRPLGDWEGAPGEDGRWQATVDVYDLAREKAYFFRVRVSPYHDWAVSRSGDYYIMDYGSPAAPGRPPRLQIRRYRTDWE